MTQHPNETPEPLAQGQAGEMGLPAPFGYVPFLGEFYPSDQLDEEVKNDPAVVGLYTAEQMREYATAALQAKDAEIAEWRKLLDPAILHANLLRGLPAQLTREQLLHLLGDDAEIAGLKIDAGRYRWLREQPNDVEAPRIDVVYWQVEDEASNAGDGLRMEELDAAIDAAIRAQTGGEHD